MTTQIPDPSKPAITVRVHIVFEYTIQQVPLKRPASAVQRHLDFNVIVDMSPTSLDDRGYPDPRALWFAERMFLKGLEGKHDPDVRILAWRCHLKGDPFILSEFAIRLPASSL